MKNIIFKENNFRTNINATDLNIANHKKLMLEAALNE